MFDGKLLEENYTLLQCALSHGSEVLMLVGKIGVLPGKGMTTIISSLNSYNSLFNILCEKIL